MKPVTPIQVQKFQGKKLTPDIVTVTAASESVRPRRCRYEIVPKGSTGEEKQALIKAYKASLYQANKEFFKEKARARYAASDRAVEKAKRAEYYKSNKEASKARHTAWKAANPDRLKVLEQRYRDNNKTSIKESSLRYRTKEDVRAKLKQRAAEWHENNKKYKNGYVSEWRSRNIEKCAAHRQRRRALRTGAIGSHTEADLIRIRGAQKDKCAYCRAILRGKGHADHIISLSRGGSNNSSNMQWLCADCNLRKNAGDPVTFARTKGLLI